MMNLHLLIILAFLLYVFPANGKTEKDSISSNKRLGLAVGYSYNTIRNEYFPYNRLLNQGASPVVDYRDQIYKNSFHGKDLVMLFEINFQKNNIIHSFNSGYERGKTESWSIYHSDGEFKKFFLKYEVKLIPKPRIDRFLSPFIGSSLMYSNMNLSDVRYSYYSPQNKFYIDETSNAFLVQVPFGILFNIKKAYLNIEVLSNINFIAFVSGKHNFVSSPTSGFESEEITYNRLLFINKFISDNYSIQNIQLKIGIRIPLKAI